MTRFQYGGMRGWLAPRTLFTCLLLSISSIQSSNATLAQPRFWNLEDCIHYAWENNFQIKIGQLEQQQRKLDHDNGRAAFLPTLTSSLSTHPESANPFQWKWGWELLANWSVFEGGRRVQEYHASKAIWYGSIAQNKQLRTQLREEITHQYLQTQLARDLLQLAEQSRRNIETQRTHTSNLVQAGSLPYASLSELEARVAQVLYQEIQAENLYQQEMLSLRQLLNLLPEQPFDLDTCRSSTTRPSWTGADVQSLFLQTQQQPQLVLARHQVEANRRQWMAAQGSLFPSLFLQAGANSMAPNQIWVGIGLQWTLLDQGRVARTIRQAELRYRQSELELQQISQNHFKTLQTLIHEAECAYQQFLAAQRNLQAQEESFQHVVHKFNLGLLDGRDYALAHQEKINAQSEMLQSQYAYWFQCKVLEYYQNDELDGE